MPTPPTTPAAAGETTTTETSPASAARHRPFNPATPFQDVELAMAGTTSPATAGETNATAYQIKKRHPPNGKDAGRKSSKSSSSSAGMLHGIIHARYGELDFVPVKAAEFGWAALHILYACIRLPDGLPASRSGPLSSPCANTCFRHGAFCPCQHHTHTRSGPNDEAYAAERL